MEHPHFSELKSQTPEQFFGRAGVDLSVRGDNKQTLLHQAVAFSRLEFIPILLAKGVPVDAQNRNGQTALHYAATFANRGRSSCCWPRGLRSPSKTSSATTPPGRPRSWRSARSTNHDLA